MFRPRRVGRSPVRPGRQSRETERQLGSLVNSQKFVAYELARRRSLRRWTFFYLTTIVVLLIVAGVVLSLWLSQKRELDALRTLVLSIDDERSLLQERLELKEQEKRTCEDQREAEQGNFTESFGIEVVNRSAELEQESTVSKEPSVVEKEDETVKPPSETEEAEAENKSEMREKGHWGWVSKFQYRWTFQDTYGWPFMVLFWPPLFLMVRFFLFGRYQP